MSVPKLFGSSGIRGDAKLLFTNQFCFDVGRAFAKFLDKYQQNNLVAIGMDPRKSSPRIKSAFAAGLAFEKVKVIDEGIAPAPAMNYILIANPSLGGSAMITGSHIREDFNGIKFFAFKEEILKNHEGEIENIYKRIRRQIPFKKEGLSLKFKKENRANESYRRMLFKLAHLPYPKWKVVLDLGNGCQTKVLPTLFKKLGIKTLLINNSLKSKDFIARDTDAIESGGAALENLQNKVRKEGANFGIAYDGDGDRGVFIDENGNYIPGDYSGALLAKYSKTRVIVTPINTSQVVDYLGKPVIRTKVGSPYVVAAMKETGAIFGFELNGGGISAENMMSRDLGSVTLKMLNLLKMKGKSLSELVDILPKFFLYRGKVDCPVKLNPIIIKRARGTFRGVKTEELDGLKIWLDKNTWILFRPSANAPEFRVFAEAKERIKAQELAEQGINFVKTIIQKRS